MKKILLIAFLFVVVLVIEMNNRQLFFSDTAAKESELTEVRITSEEDLFTDENASAVTEIVKKFPPKAISIFSAQNWTIFISETRSSGIDYNEKKITYVPKEDEKLYKALAAFCYHAIGKKDPYFKTIADQRKVTELERFYVDGLLQYIENGENLLNSDMELYNYFNVKHTED